MSRRQDSLQVPPDKQITHVVILLPGHLEHITKGNVPRSAGILGINNDKNNKAHYQKCLWSAGVSMWIAILKNVIQSRFQLPSLTTAESLIWIRQLENVHAACLHEGGLQYAGVSKLLLFCPVYKKVNRFERGEEKIKTLNETLIYRFSHSDLPSLLLTPQHMHEPKVPFLPLFCGSRAETQLNMLLTATVVLGGIRTQSGFHTGS